MSDRMAPFRDNNTYKRLRGEEKKTISALAGEYSLTFQDIKILIDIARDLETWGEGSLKDYWIAPDETNLKGKQLKQFLINRVREKWEDLKTGEKDYSAFAACTDSKGSSINYIQTDDDSTILGSCPVASEKTRCCNLQTLDVVNNCGFDCTYCSIQSFFDGNRVYFQKNLKEKLKKIQLDREKRYHIGTGQSSDSLMWGNRDGILDHLKDFAIDHPNVVLELKTKSKNISWLLDNEIPPNVIVTWSLNTQTIIDNEEHLTASLGERLASARKVADRGIKVGFHFHPIIQYKGWKEEYGEITAGIQKDFTPDETALISMGTLTFIKPVIRKIRDRDLRSKILEMPLTEAGGKLSYPLEIKRELFGHVYNSFDKEWKDNVFFYLCMEDPSLWEPLFGRYYENNGDFERDMINSYFRKVNH